MFRKRKIVFNDITAGQLKEIHFDILKSFASAILVRALSVERDRNSTHTCFNTKWNFRLRKLGKTGVKWT